MSKIEWTDETWNPVVGCTRVSAGCDNCYAVRMSHRLEGMGQERYAGLTVLNNKGARHFKGEVRTVPEVLDRPLRWRKPRMVFVNSMSDLFHPGVPFEFTNRVFDVMWRCPQHVFQVLTKRPETMLEFVRRHASRHEFNWGVDPINRFAMNCGDAFDLYNNGLRNNCGWCYDRDDDEDDRDCQHPENEEGYCEAKSCPIGNPIDNKNELIKLGFDGYDWVKDDRGNEYASDPDLVRLHTRPQGAFCRNVWLGVSTESQPVFDARVKYLRSLRHEIPHAILFLSIEPQLGPIDISRALEWCEFSVLAGSDRPKRKRVIDWVIVGGESGKGARPCDVAWIRSIISQCREAAVPCFVKQLGARPQVFHEHMPYERACGFWPADGSLDSEEWILNVRNKKGGDPDEWPEDLRVREWPEERE